VPQFEELGFYTLAGAPASSRDLIAEVKAAEQLGLGYAFISERFNLKEAATLSGAAGAVSETIRIATAATNHHTRHPTITAAYGSTMHSLTGGRFTLGIGRGVDRLWDAMGLPHITTAQMEDWAGLMRRLWAGEVILGHDGPAGKWPYLALDGIQDFDIPLGLVAFGPNSLKLGGRAFDQVVLHTFFTDETTARVVKTVKDSAEQAGRDPDAVQVWSCFATVGDHIAPDLQLKKTVGRLATYLQGYGDLLVRTNNWDPAVLERFRADEFVANFRGAIDRAATTEELKHVATLIPDEWLEPMAKGTPEQCVLAVRNQFDLGCDGVILHGATPDELEPVVKAYAARA
jgi:probable F420-dependent oxidoreductase